MNLRVFVCVLTHFLLSPLGASISVTSPGVTFDLTQAGSNGDLFVASSTPADSSSYSLSRMLLTRNADESYSATMVGLVPAQVRLNNEVTGSKDNPAVRVPSYSDNPLVGQHINCLTALKQFPVVAFGSVATEVHAVALIQDVAAGSAALLNKQPFGDALGALAKNIVALEAGPLTRATGDARSPYISPNFLFAAVTPSDSSYFQGQDGAGIGIALVLPDGILPLDAAGRNSGAQAAAITAAMAQITGAESISNVTALCFNPYLEKLFVALSLEGGGVALMVGSLEVPTRSLQGALINRVAVRDLRFTTSACIVGATGVNVADDWDDNDYIVAVKGADALELQHLGIMNASTGANLAVVSRGDTGVYAVPITTAGMLARKDDMNTAATLGSTDQLLQTTDAAARVGAGSTPDAVTSLMVRGDAVYISCAGTDAGTYGVFVSQALFDRTGSVRAWTPWQPYGAMTDAVHGFALDATGALRYLTGEQDTISTQLWGAGARNSFWGGSSSDDSIGLVTRCNAFFDPLVGGVQSAQSVQGTGGAVDWYNTSPQIGDDSTLLMLTGRNKVLLASTRVSGTVTAGSSFTDDALIYGYDLAGTSAEIGMVTTAAVSRGDSFLTADGWLFIGGSDGIAVLAKSSGTGWGGLSGALDDVSSLDSDYSFRSLLQSDGSSFSQVRQILTDAQAV